MQKIAGFLLLICFFALFSSPLAALTPGQPCPSFILSGLFGEIFDSNQVLGKKPLLIWLTNFDEFSAGSIPKLINLATLNRPEVEFIIISVNGSDKSAAQKAGQDFSISFPVLIDPDGSVIRKLSDFYTPGVAPLENLILVGKDKTIKLINNYPGLPIKTLETKLKELI